MDLEGVAGQTANGTTRKSFGDFFHFSTRLRQNSEPFKMTAESHKNSMKRDDAEHTQSCATPSIMTQPGTPHSPLARARGMLGEASQSLPPRSVDDSPATYLLKVEAHVPRRLIATVLAQSNEHFFKAALRRYMNGFSFNDDPLDMALRKMVMEAELPKETQEIDRVLQAFAERYHECNPGIYQSDEQAYFIAFSLLILHTDVFNKNNKRKMQKQDYVRNTKDSSIADEILECFYDNISYTPFIRVEEDSTINAAVLAPSSTMQIKRKLFRVGSTDGLSKPPKDPVDPYALIFEGRLGILRPDLRNVLQLEDIYSYISP
ncbi:hypothetical protein KEM52_002241, partial [Ascosphaera acerosa]